MVAFAMTAFVACSKDNDDNTSNNGGNGIPTLNIPSNTMVYDGVTYPLRATGLLTAESVEGNSVFPKFGIIFRIIILKFGIFFWIINFILYLCSRK